MKRFLVPVLVLLIGFGKSAASAQSVSAFLGGGTASGVGQLNVDTNYGWTVLGGLEVFAGLPQSMSVGITGSYTRIPYKTGGFGEAEQVTSISGDLGYHSPMASDNALGLYAKAAGGVQVRHYNPGSSGYLGKTTARPEVTFRVGALIATSFLPRGFVEAHVSTRSDAGFAALVAGVNVPF